MAAIGTEMPFPCTVIFAAAEFLIGGYRPNSD